MAAATAGEAVATVAAVAGAARCYRGAAEGLGEVLLLPASCADDQRHGVGSRFWQIPWRWDIFRVGCQCQVARAERRDSAHRAEQERHIVC